MVGVTVLKQAVIFSDLTTIQLELISSICEERDYQPGELVFAENTAGAELYVIANGEVQIQIDTLAPEGATDPNGASRVARTIAVLRRGQSFGEVALVDEGRRSAAARCGQSATHLLIVPHEKLTLLCETYPQLGFRLMRNLAADLAAKIRNTDLQIRDQIYWAPAQKP